MSRIHGEFPARCKTRLTRDQAKLQPGYYPWITRGIRSKTGVTRLHSNRKNRGRFQRWRDAGVATTTPRNRPFKRFFSLRKTEWTREAKHTDKVFRSERLFFRRFSVFFSAAFRDGANFRVLDEKFRERNEVVELSILVRVETKRLTETSECRPFCARDSDA